MESTVFQRIKDLARRGKSPVEIASLVHYSVESVRRALKSRDEAEYRTLYHTGPVGPPRTVNRASRYKDGMKRHIVTEEVYRRVRILLNSGVEHRTISDILEIGETSVGRIARAETYEDYTSERAEEARERANRRASAAETMGETNETHEDGEGAAPADSVPSDIVPLMYQTLHDMVGILFTIASRQADELDLLRRLLATWESVPTTEKKEGDHD